MTQLVYHMTWIQQVLVPSTEPVNISVWIGVVMIGWSLEKLFGMGWWKR